MPTPAQITKVLNNSCNQSIRDRGLALYQDGHVTIHELRIVGGNISVTAEVIGSHGTVYEQNISIKNSKLSSDYCTCPYNWQGICKHTAAVLYQVKAELEGTKKQVIEGKIQRASDLQQRSTDQPFEIAFQETAEGEVEIDLSAAKNSGVWNRADSLMWSHQFDIKLFEDYMEVSVENQRAFRSPAGYPVVTIKPEWSTLILTVTSKPLKTVETLRVEEVLALMYITRDGQCDLFQLLEEKRRDTQMLRVAKTYGIDDLRVARKYLRINEDYRRGREMILLKENMPTLMTLGQSVEEFPYLPTSQFAQEVLNSQRAKKDEKRLLFFYLYIEEKTFHFYDLLTIVPFVSTVKKDGTLHVNKATTYEDLPGYDQFATTQWQAELIEISRETSSNQFNEKLADSVKRLSSIDTKKHFAANENLKQLKAIRELLQEHEEMPYFSDYAQHGRISTNDLHGPIRLDFGHQISWELQYRDGLYELEPFLSVGTEKYRWSSPAINRIHFLLFEVDGLYYFFNSVHEASLLSAYAEGTQPFAATETTLPLLLQNVVKPVSRLFEISFVDLPEAITHRYVNANSPRKAIYFKELDKTIYITPRVYYDEVAVELFDRGIGLDIDAHEIREVVRNEPLEAEFKAFMMAAHPHFDEQWEDGFLYLTFEEFIDNYWFHDFTGQCEAQGIEVYGFDEFEKLKYSPHKTKVMTNASSGIDWFDLKVTITVGDEQVSLKDVRKAILARQQYVKLGSGKLAVLPKEWVKRLSQYFRVGKVEKEGVKISKFQFNVLEEVFNDLDELQIVKEIRQKKARLRDFDEIKEVAVPEINGTLRPYQQKGFEWLRFLHEYGWGGILADDMGLGKTIQVIAFIKSLVDQGMNKHLVVVPTSLLFNWKNEIEKFCPSLSYLIYHGPDRERDHQVWEQYDIMLTSYGILVSDFTSFKGYTFDYCVLDESQAIKNPLSKRFKAALSIKANKRLVMTGTPIENNTFDLYAQMTFVNPGMFISTEQFRKNYSNAIDKEADQQVAAELNRVIAPFLLRRTKQLVAQELPPKVEDVIYCEMEPEQRKVYEAHRNAYRNDILGMIEENGLESSKLHILQALTKLRQICDSPALLKGEDQYGDQSIKIKELLNHVKEKTGNHKLLVFSQFVSMLQLVKAELDREEINYAYLDGQTTQKNRKKAVDTFQEDEETRVFLISLKAGGTGLNLTAADYVYIVDPWWNPAVENQAIDRSYRIGQDKKVIAYRMICKDTLEEKIMDYKARKQSVADALIKTDESIMKQITQEEMMALFG